MDLSYPIGKFDFQQVISPVQYPELIGQIAAAPALYRDAVRGLDDAQLDTPYRPGGWTVRQTVHHVADSHMNSFIRLRLALTEIEPTISAYDEKAWGELCDSRTAPVELSLQLIENLHARWVVLLEEMSPADFAPLLPASGTGAWYAWIPTWRFTPGTAGTMRRTLPGFAPKKRLEIG